MPRYNKHEDFEAGLKLVTPFFNSLGYSLAIAEPQADKEGTFYLATFTCKPRSVELHHLYSLGPVIYRIGENFIEHTSYLKALGIASNACYPSYEDDSRSGYSALLLDLQNLLSPFFVGSAENFSAVAREYMETQRQRTQEAQQRFPYWGSGEERLKAQARELFRQKRFNEVVQIEAQIRFPEFLTEAEQLMFSMARKRTEN